MTTQATFTLNKTHHFGIIVSDLDRMIRFYRELFGKEPDTVAPKVHGPPFAKQTGFDGAEVRVAFFELDGAALELIEYKTPKGGELNPAINDVRAKHLCFEIDDIDEAYAQLEARNLEGLAFHNEPSTMGADQGPLEGYRWVYFRDPEGNLLELMQEPG